MLDLTMVAFRERLRDELDASQLAAELLAAARDRFDPLVAVLWTDGFAEGDGTDALPPFDATDPLAGYAVRHPEPVSLDRIELASPALDAARAVGATLLAPLVSLGVVAGMLLLGPRRNGSPYGPDELRFLDELCALAAGALRVARLTDLGAASEQARAATAEELRLAQSIQRGLLPRELPVLPGWRIDASYQPARVIGGDLYDFISLPGDLLAILLGDASDKSIPAALTMANARTVIRAAVQRLVLPGLALARANEILADQLPPGTFVTCFLAVLDPATGRLRYANGGHCPPQMRTVEGVTELRVTGWPLGMMPGISYEERETILPEGSTVVLFSDGLIETHDPSGAMFGTERLTTTLGASGPPDGLIPVLLDAHRRFAGSEWEQEDDLTLVTLTRQLPPSALAERTIFELDLSSRPGSERDIAEQVLAAVAELPLSQRQRERLLTAVAEGVMNAIEHGNQNRPELRVTVTVVLRGDALVVQIRDQGLSGEIPEHTAPDLDAKLAGLQSPRGWGLFLIGKLVDELHTETTLAGHVMELTLRLDKSET